MEQSSGIAASGTADLLSHIRGLGIKLWVEGDKLRCVSPTGVLGAELKDQLAKRKAEIIAFLRATEEGAQANSPVSRLVHRDGVLPVTHAQQRLWFIDQLEQGSPAYNIPSALRLVGPLDHSVLERALAEVVRRHETLRSKVVTVDGAPGCVVVPFDGWRITVLDLCDRPAEERAADARKIVAAEAARPFSLADGPLFHATLIQLGPQEHVLLIVVHHIVFDGWSLGILINELRVLYAAFSAGEPSPLPPLPIQYVDYAGWQRQWLDNDALAEQLDYWMRKLHGELPVLELPFDRPRPPLQSYAGAITSIEYAAALADRLRDLARSENVTMFTMLVAGLVALLHRYSGQEDIIVGSASANRGRVEVEGLIGFFVNNLVLRIDLSGSPTFRQLLRQVKETALEADANSALPFERLVEALQPRRTLSHAPIFQVMMNLQNVPSAGLGGLRFSGVEVEPFPFTFELTRFDLNIDLTESERSLTAFATFNTDLFDKDTIDRLLAHYGQLLVAAAAEPDRRVAELPLDVHARVALATRPLATRRRKGESFVTAFERAAESHADAIAVVCGATQLSYRELNRRANQLARRLIALGVKAEAPVGICVRRSVEMLVGLLGIMKSGAAYVPLDQAYPPARLALVVNDARLRAVVVDRDSRALFAGAEAALIDVDGDSERLAAESGANCGRRTRAENLAYIIYTSGSTGAPKGVQIEHGSLLNLLESMQREPGFGAADTMLAVTTIAFDISALELFLPLMAGGRVVIAEATDVRDARRLTSILAESRATVMQATPSTWRLLIDSGWSEGRGLKALCGGEALSRELADRLLGTGAELWNMYGPTETSIWSLCAKVEPSGTVSIGQPISNTSVHILDDQLAPVPIGVYGELHIGGAGLTRAYLNRPELNAEKFVTNPFRAANLAERLLIWALGSSYEPRLYKTGDLARWRRDGSIEFLGRRDHQVKIRGFRIELGEIESVIERYPGITQAVAVVHDYGEGDRRIAAYWVGKPDPAPNATQLRQFLETQLPEYMLPAAFMRLEQVPLTPNGKVDRSKLPRPGVERPNIAAAFVAPRTTVEKQVASVWGQTLGLDTVGIDDSFFDLGGNSLLVVQVQSKLRSQLSRDVPLLELFRRPTVRSLAEFFDGGSPAQDFVERVKDRARKHQHVLRSDKR
jgi:amino acid adenylation domain-containing protein